MSQVPPVPLPRSRTARRDIIPSSMASSPTSQLPPTPVRRPIPLPRLIGNFRSERNILATLTRRSSNSSPSATANEEEDIVEKTLEESQDPFRTICFQSPLKGDKFQFNISAPEDLDSSHENGAVTDNSGRDTPPSPEPPFYPPPPLPDQSVYDEVQSLPGSKSSPWFSIVPRPMSQPVTTKLGLTGDEESGDDIYPYSWTESIPDDRAESIYEDIADTLESQSSAGGGSSHTGDWSSGSDGGPKNLSLPRSDSWRFYDTVETRLDPEKTIERDKNGKEKAGRVKLSSHTESCPEEYENVVIVSAPATASSDHSDPFVWNSAPTTVRHSAPSDAGSPAALYPGRIPLLIPAPASVGSSTSVTNNTSSSHSSITQNAESEDGDILSDMVSIRKREIGFHRPVTQSVILEFDPLYDKKTEKQNSPSDISKVFGAASSEPPYGKIRKDKQIGRDKACVEKKVVTKVPDIFVELPSPTKSIETFPTESQTPTSSTVVSSEIPVRAETPKPTTEEHLYDVSQSDASTSTEKPPPLPRRVESIDQENPPLEIRSNNSTENAKGDDSFLKVYRSSCRSERWTSMKKHAKKLLNGKMPERASQTSLESADTPGEGKLSIFYQPTESVEVEIPPRPPSGMSSSPVNITINHSGVLYQVAGGAVGAVGAVSGGAWCGAQVRWFTIGQGKLTWWRESGAGAASYLPLERLTSISIAADRPSPSADDESLSCFELGVLGTKSNWMGRHGGGNATPHSLLLGANSSSERRVWMQKLLESVVPPMCFPSHAVMDFSRAGSAHIKEGISGKWCQGWLLLYQRTLFYFASGMSNSKEANLQHARCISLTKEEDGGGSSILVDTQGGCAIYIRPISFESGSFFHSASIKFLGSKNTVSAWKSALKTAAVESGPQIAEQQLTVDNIPVIVDKCINFIYAHGGMSEGIYRRSGSNNAVTRLLTAFKRDAWDVQLTRRDFTEYDVASVLKRFFRDLPEPLLTATLHDEFCEVAECSADKKVSLYRDLLSKLPIVNCKTLRRLLAHLSYVHGQRERNLMPVENLAAIWGPTLMHVEGNDTLGWSRRESEVVMDLVSLFSSIFDVSPEEEEREKQMQEVLERYHRAASGSPSTSMPASPSSSIRASPDTAIAFPGGRMPPSGDLKIWVHILPSVSTTDKGNNCIHITLSPQKLAWQVAMELCQKLGLDKKKEWGLEEHVLGGALIRPLHPTERVLDAVLRWGYWDEMDRRDNFIALGPATLYTDVAPLIMSKTPPTVNGKLRFADTRAKSFKTFTFEFSQAKLSYYKDERGSNKIAEWKVEDILWYLGHEPKRNPQTRWSITFINRHKKVSRSKEAPFFGHTIAGTSSEEKLRWATALLLGEHPDGLSYHSRTDLMQ